MFETLYLHRATKRCYDYGGLLDTEHSLRGSWGPHPVWFKKTFELNGDPKTMQEAKALAEPLGLTVEWGDPVELRYDINPHGLI